MPFTGDFAKLGKMIEAMGKLSNQQFVATASKNIGIIADGLAVTGAQTATSPTGQAWKALKKGGQAMAGISSDIVLESRGNGFVIKVTPRLKNGVDYIGILQRGSKGRIFHNGKRLSQREAKSFAKGTVFQKLGPVIPARRILPKKSLPKRWGNLFAQEVLRLFKEATTL